MRKLSQFTDPALKLARRTCPLRFGGLDFSPVALLVAISLGGQFLSDSLKFIGAGYSSMVLLPLAIRALLSLLQQAAWLLMVLMAARIIISLVNPAYNNAIVLAVYGLTEPLLAPLRRWFPKGPKGLDLKAVVVLAGLFLFQALILDNLAKTNFSWIMQMAPSPSSFPF